ncbi:MAG TPA: acylphosphatase, partial [Solirubrobacterales bacterium]|nr:acylphosphatase [Solirubrobacterales bacterium]
MPAKSKGKGLRVAVRGQVQGVGFRYLTVERAHELGVLGWVRNEDDGTVLVHAEGPEEAVDALVEWLGEGPPGAEVDEVDVEPGKVEG